MVGGSMSDRPQFRGAAARQRAGIRRAHGQTAVDLQASFRGAGEFGNETWENDSWTYTGMANLWSLISADEAAGLAYFPLSSPTNDMYGGHRLGDNLFADSLVCVRCATGERVWHYQLVHHDLWDYDLPAAPILADITVEGRRDQGCRAAHEAGVRLRLRPADRAAGLADRRAAGAQVGHTGRAHLADAAVSDQAAAVRPPGRHDGRPDRLHAGASRGGARDRQAVPDWAAVHAAVKCGATGRAASQGTVQLPGSVGGADWQGGAFDPETGMLYVQSITAPFVADIVKGDPKRTNLDYLPGLRAYPPGRRGCRCSSRRTAASRRSI